jgi:hypothetical protein
MEVDQGPNWGCSAKGRKNLKPCLQSYIHFNAWNYFVLYRKYMVAFFDIIMLNLRSLL